MLARAFIPAAVVLLLSGAVFEGSLAASPRDTEEQLLARLEKEQNPVKRAKYEIRLGRLKLEQAIAAYNQGNLEQGGQLLSAHAERMKSSWQTLLDSGRNAGRHPQGFKELEIALREDARLLEDLKRHVPYFNRDPIENAARENEQLRIEVLRALFPAARPATKKTDTSGTL